MNISDKNLLKKLKTLREVERETLEQIIIHLRELHERRLYADLGYSTLFKYLVKELGYSEGSAYRRQKAMELIIDFPETQEMMKTGELNLTVAADVQNASKELSRSETKRLISNVKCKSKDEARIEINKVTQCFSTEKREVKRSVTESTSRFSVTLSNKTLFKLEKYKALKKISTEEALDQLLDLGFEEIEIYLSTRKRSRGSKGRTIPAAIRKEVFQRANNQCEFPGCGDFHHLEVEHIHPWAKGGGHDLSNLKLYCRTHNQRAAVKAFGKEAISKYFR